VSRIDNLQMARIARLAGAPLDTGAGVDLFTKLGETVKEGHPLYCIYADFDADFRFAREQAERNSGYTIGITPPAGLGDVEL
jgi:thymidine phosphorylase